MIDDIVEIAGEAYDQDSTAAARVGVDTRFGVSGCFLPTKYDRRNIEAEAITIGRPDFARAVIEQSVIPCLRAPLLHCFPVPLTLCDLGSCGFVKQGERDGLILCCTASLHPCFLGVGAQGNKDGYFFADSGAGDSASFWKRGSLRSGSNIGSSRSSAGVSGGICPKVFALLLRRERGDDFLEARIAAEREVRLRSGDPVSLGDHLRFHGGV